MTRYEYKVLPAPKKGEKSKAAKTTPDRFALALTNMMNEMAADGWSYLRADTLPCDERAGLTGTKTVFQNMLIFRRAAHPQAAPPPPPPVSAAPKRSPLAAEPSEARPISAPTPKPS
jgi:hypothetical protein